MDDLALFLRQLAAETLTSVMVEVAAERAVHQLRERRLCRASRLPCRQAAPRHLVHALRGNATQPGASWRSAYIAIALNHEHHQQHLPATAGQPVAQFTTDGHAGQPAWAGGGDAYLPDVLPGLRVARFAAGLAHSSALPPGPGYRDRPAHRF